MPGVQKPHCAAPWSTNARCRGLIVPLLANPSTVSIALPSALTAGYMHEYTAFPFRMTVQAPQPP